MRRFGFPTRRGSAPVARDRLKMMLAQDRALFGRRDLIASLREDILAAIGKHFSVEGEKVRVNLNRRGGVSTLGIDIDLPAYKSQGLAGA
jgi:cell division topological specificity factor